ncbi:MAG: hypothetical protein M3438_07690 [Pseudomonadota bacterium]|nr:hypothetical protein [Pseudomonadota bacterium]
MESEQTYYARRAEAERSAAAKAADARARHAHLDLAARFDLLATAVGEIDCALRPQERPTHRHFSAGPFQF